MKKLVGLLAIATLMALTLCSCAPDKGVSQIDDIEASLIQLLNASGAENVVVYDSSELTAEILESRRGTTVVERCIGVVINAEQGDGVVLNTSDAEYNYIGFHGICWPLNNGTILLSYMVYNPYNNEVDDIVERYDFILDVKWERLNEICMSFGA